jgi:hypothetical protein
MSGRFCAGETLDWPVSLCHIAALAKTGSVLRPDASIHALRRGPTVPTNDRKPPTWNLAVVLGPLLPAGLSSGHFRSGRSSTAQHAIAFSLVGNRHAGRSIYWVTDSRLARRAMSSPCFGHNLVEIETPAAPAWHAQVCAGRAGAFMKGKLHRGELLTAVLSRSAGLRTERRLSHVFTLDVLGHSRLLHITDAAINIAPNLTALADIVQNALDLVRALGVDCPRSAVLSSVETVSDRLPLTLLAAAICKMHDRGQITGGLVDGPLAFDNAISAAAARDKGITSPVAGLADILVAPNLESGNMIAKQLTHLAGAEAAGIALGAQVPIMLTSRADTAAARVASAALARLAATRPV